MPSANSRVPHLTSQNEITYLTVQQYLHPAQHQMFTTHEQPASQLYCCKKPQARGTLLNPKCTGTPLDIVGSFFPYSLGSLLSCKDIPFLTANKLFAAHTRKIKTYPNPQPTVRSVPGSLARHLDRKSLVAFQAQSDTVRSSNLHEDPLQLQWCSSW